MQKEPDSFRLSVDDVAEQLTAKEVAAAVWPLLDDDQKEEAFGFLGFRCTNCDDWHSDRVTASLCCERVCKECGVEIGPWEEPQDMTLDLCEECWTREHVGEHE